MSLESEARRRLAVTHGGAHICLDPARVLAVLEAAEKMHYCVSCYEPVAAHVPDCELAALKAECEALTGQEQEGE